MIRGVLLFAGFRIKLQLFMDSIAAHGICKREEVGRIRHLGRKIFMVTHVVQTRTMISVNDD